MHVVHCDLIVGLPRALDGSHAILLLYDGFSRLTFGIPLTSEKADYVVKKLMSHFVSAFGLPWALHSDNGRNIDGSLIRHLALMLGVIKTSTPPHTPNANPTETMCGAVSMLIRKALNESDKRYWSLCLPFILNALNSTVHTATGYSPNSLFFGRFQERELVMKESLKLRKRTGINMPELILTNQETLCLLRIITQPLALVERN